MTEVGAYDAKTNLGQLLNRVATGERILITRHGMPVAMLQPVPPSKGMPAEQAIAELKAFRVFPWLFSALFVKIDSL